MVLFDYSAAILFLLVIMFAFRGRGSADDSTRKLVRFIVAVTLIVPPCMHFAGHYRSMYRWMTFIPLAIAVPRLMEWEAVAISRSIRRTALVAVSFSVFLGVPLRSLAIIPTWTSRSMKPFERVAAQVVRPSDVVVCTGNLYFGIRPQASLLYTYGLPARAELALAKDLPTNDVTLLCVTPRDFKPVTQIVGGNWKLVPLAGITEAAEFARSRYAADFYRRAPD